MEDIKNKSFAVGYSGGLDSTLIALLMGKRYSGGGVHLLTARHGFGHVFTWMPNRHVADLRRHLGEDRVFHTLACIEKEFKALVLSGCLDTYKRFGRSNFFVCLGCTLAIDVHLISYCLEHKAPTVVWGYTPRGSDFAVMSLPETCFERRAFYSRYGLLYRVPLAEMHMEKPEERDLYDQVGIWQGIRFRKIAMGVQPPCLWGITMHHLDIMFEVHPQPDRRQVVSFIKDRSALMDRLIRERLAEKGIFDIEERIAELRRINESEWEKYGPEGRLLDDMEERRIFAETTGLSSIALKKFPNSVPLFDHEALSRDGRRL